MVWYNWETNEKGHNLSLTLLRNSCHWNNKMNKRDWNYFEKGYWRCRQVCHLYFPARKSVIILQKPSSELARKHDKSQPHNYFPQSLFSPTLRKREKNLRKPFLHLGIQKTDLSYGALYSLNNKKSYLNRRRHLFEVRCLFKDLQYYFYISFFFISN